MTLQIRTRRDPTTLVPVEQTLGAGPWLVMSPHDDDAVLGLGATMHAAARLGIEVHIAVVTDGRMGWDDPKDAERLIAIRAGELDRSCEAIGVPLERLHRLGFPDGSLNLHAGCRTEADGTGVGRAITRLMRKIRPGAVFCATNADLHGDHRITADETAMAIAWASGAIWREFGDPIPAPRLWHYAVYCDFPTPPDCQIRSDTEDIGAKIASCRCFASQPFIDDLVATLRADGPVEYLHEATWNPYRPAHYASLFQQTTATNDAVIIDDAKQLLPGLEKEVTWPSLEAALKKTPRLTVVAEGSSRLFVSGFARHLLRRWNAGITIESCGGRAAERNAGGQEIVVSNSGATREVAEHVAKTPDRQRWALLGQAGGVLAESVSDHRILLAKPEQAVAATASVFLQAYTLGSVLARVAGKDVPTAALRSAVEGLLTNTMPAALCEALHGAKRLFWADDESGVADELALKTMELCGLPGISAPGTMALHGIEEIFAPEDRVIWLHADARDAALRAKVAASTDTPQIVLSDYLVLPEVGPWRELLLLVVGWRLLGDLAVSLGRDPAKAQRARKVGNPMPGK